MAAEAHTHVDDPEVAASKRLWVEMRTPEGVVFSGKARSVTIPGAKGSMGVLPRHAPLMSSLTTGVTKIRDADDQVHSFITGVGFVEVYRNQVLVLVDFADDPAVIDVARAQAARDRAKARLLHPGEEVDVARAEAAMDRATMRLRFAR